ncbi:hypothetical protein BDW22DRAFT_1390606 [Trametopsis cervina]|nr:hypothetical protein BDW22DRAFT_1390606 [Trametopsis cervina]
MSSSLLDVTHEIKLDHDNVRDLFSRFQSTTDYTQKKAIANTLIREMAIHGDAEEISIYNAYQRLGLGDSEQHNKEEHAEIKKLVFKADIHSFGSADYDSVLSNAVTTFISHAQEEEDQQFAKLRSALSPEENDKLAREFLKARTTVPTRPHPPAPQTGGIVQKAVGLQGSLIDKAIELVQGRDFVDLKLSHPESF